jgi:hypothetical protein
MFLTWCDYCAAGGGSGVLKVKGYMTEWDSGYAMQKLNSMKSGAVV